jgi:hypothetical protein
LFVYLDNAQFQKNGYQNRNQIKSASGTQWLTIPVLRKSNTPINQVLINNNTNWQKKHINSLITNYRKSRFFDSFFPILEKLYSREYGRLVDFIYRFDTIILEYFDIKTPLMFASELDSHKTRTAQLVDILQKTHATHYLSGVGGKQYMDLSLFESSDIEIVWQEMSDLKYEQLFTNVEFLPNLSIIDIIFNMGNRVEL